MNIPNLVTTIGYSAFRGCSGFTEVFYNATNCADVNNNSWPFYGCGGTLAIGDNVERISANMFRSGAFTGSLTIPNSVTTIGDGAFYGCSGLTGSLTIPNSVTTIGGSAFYGCSGLTGSLTIPNSLTSIGSSVFRGCSGLTGSLTIPNSVTSIGNHAFRGCRGFTGSLTIPNSVTKILNYSFYGCSGFTGSLTIPNSVTLIGASAFRDCSGFTGSLTIGNSVTSIGEYAFYGCSGFTGSLTIPNSVTVIGVSAFYDCSGFTGSLTIGNSLTSIGDNAFYNCSGFMGNLVIPSSVTYLSGFNGCTGFTGDLTIPNSVTAIGGSAFDGCSGLTGSLTIPNSVTTIDYYAFDGCSGFTGSLTIPNSVTSIGASAFRDCSGFTGSLTIPNSVTSIGNYAFYNCSGFTGSLTIGNSVTTIGPSTFNGCSGLTLLTIGNSVTSIGQSAFCYCSGLTSITCLAATPPSLEYTYYYEGFPFHAVSAAIPVYVPCGTKAVYENTSDWNEFSNFHADIGIDIVTSANPPESGMVSEGSYCFDEICTLTATANEGYTFVNWTENGGLVSSNPIYSFTVLGARTLVANFVPSNYEITVAANPPEGGNVTGMGNYDHGTAATLTATANEGYTFQSWTNNGTVVSTEATYTFIVTEAAEYVANFSSSTNHWEPEISQYEDNMTITCVIQLDGVEQYTTLLELGAFCGTECRGSQCATYFAPTQRYIIQMTVFGENNDVISFRLYDHQLGQEVMLMPPAIITFNSNGYGSLSNPYILNFTSTITHTQALNNGWNWWSTYIELNNNDGLSQLENSIGSEGIIIKSRTNGYAEAYQYNGETSWYGTLSSINNEQMYKIRTNAACNATVEGLLAVSANHPININSGWNWIGFLCNQNVSVDVAMSGFTPENNDIVKGRNGFTTYYSDGNYNMWYGTLNTLEPGKGYMYRSNSTTQKTLVFQTSRGEANVENIIPENNFYQPDDENFADNMTITAVLEIDGEELRSEGYELAAFVGDECRGSVNLLYVEPVNRYVAFLTVFGESSETLYFRITDGTQTELSMEEISFVADGTAGTLSEPMTLRFGTTQVDENGLSKVMVYPNPSNGVFNVQGQGIRKIEVFNAFGQAVVSEETNNDYLQIDLSRFANGCYMLRVVTDNGIANSQLIKK